MSKYSFLFKNHISFSAVKAHHAALNPVVIIKRVDILIQCDKKVATRGNSTLIMNPLELPGTPMKSLFLILA